MKILHVVQSLALGGQEVLIARLAASLRARGHDVVVVPLVPGGALESRFPAGTVIPVERREGRDPLLPLRLAAVMRGSLLRQLEPALEQVVNARSVLGARLNAVDYATVSRETLKEDVTANLSKLRDTDMAEAIARLNQQMTGLQAAQQSYARIARLSLFDYL